MQPSAKNKYSDTVIRIEDKFYILASSSLVDDRTRVLKHDGCFAIFDRHGDIQAKGISEHGLFYQGTRFLSNLVLTVFGERPLLLSSTIKSDNTLMTVDLTNSDWYSDGEIIFPRGTLHIFRSKVLWRAACFEHLRFRNYGSATAELSFSIDFDADYADIFEVRGMERPQRGIMLEGRSQAESITLRYRGLDNILRETNILSSVRPAVMEDHCMHFEHRVPPQNEMAFDLVISCSIEESPPLRLSYGEAYRQASASFLEKNRAISSIETSNEQFNVWLNRSKVDLEMMMTESSDGKYPYAGVPWFSAAFGRDGIITAMQCLAFWPELARCVLEYLAKLQARDIDPSNDAEPGKILHERRLGEMARLREVPFGRYYGSVDSTPLFVMLAGLYYKRTADRQFIESIWENIQLALQWMDQYGDRDGDGFLEYHRQSDQGLVNQGWKDSYDSVFHADGSLATGPIALCEVQAYAYSAKRNAAMLAANLKDRDTAAKLLNEARELQENIWRSFWLEELSSYALALDGDKKPCAIRASNAGHVLFCGVATEDQAARVRDTLMSKQMFSGWGIRTVASGEKRYNPMSYHNGSIWPHDNALIAAGFARYNFRRPVTKLLEAMFDASTFMDLHRMPELFCGFHRREGEGPTEYPVACAPQSWAAATVFLLLQSSLGLHVNARESQILFHRPRLPESIEQIRIRGIQLGDASIDIELMRHEDDVAIHISKRTGKVEVMTIK